MSIVRVALPVTVDRLFDYWSPEGLDVRAGSVLRATLGRRRLVGVAVEMGRESEIPPERLAPIDELAALPPLPDDLLTLARFVAEYYQQPIGQCFAQMLPPLATRRRAAREERERGEQPSRAIALNADQRSALDIVLAQLDR